MPRATLPRRVAGHPTVVPEPFECEWHGGGGGVIWVSARGELDLATEPRFTQILSQALDSALLVVIDLRRLTFIDGVGIHAIVNADATARRTGHRVVLIRNLGSVGRLFALLGLTKQLKIVDLTPDIAVTDVRSAELQRSL